MNKKLLRILSLFLCILLISQQSGFAAGGGTPTDPIRRGVAQMDISSHLAQLHNAFVSDKFRPLHLRYLEFSPQQDGFRLLVDKGDTKNLADSVIEESTKELLKYFFIGLTLPNSSFWVNLRPDSAGNIIDDYLSQTDVGKILLEADLQLKKDTASFTSPQTPEGKEYWDRLYQKAEELFGSENITIPTLTRPWIVPGEIIVREATGSTSGTERAQASRSAQDNGSTRPPSADSLTTSAYIYKATLKVMLEEDYLNSNQKPVTRYQIYEFKDPRLKELNVYSSQLIRELIIPKITQEVNTAKRYAPLRQVYYSLILAQWFKAQRTENRLQRTENSYTKLIDSRNLDGFTSKESWSKTTYFQEYQRSFKDGEYNIKEPHYTATGQVVRSYFSGGVAMQNMDAALEKTSGLGPMAAAKHELELAGKGTPANPQVTFPERDLKGRFAKQPGKSPEDMVRILSGSEYRDKPFTVEQYRTLWQKVYDAELPQSTAYSDLGWAIKWGWIEKVEDSNYKLTQQGKDRHPVAVATGDDSRLFYFGGGQADGRASMNAILGKKGANLAEMTLLGLPVPPGFTIPNRFMKEYSRESNKLPSEVEQSVLDGVAEIERRTQVAFGRLKKFGNAENPLFLSVRSGAAESSPGQYKTITKVGFHKTTLDAYAREIRDASQAYFDYIMFMADYVHYVLEDDRLYGVLRSNFETASFIERYHRGNYNTLSEIASIEELKAMADRAEALFRGKTGRDFPEPRQQLIEATRAVVESCYLAQGAACNVQAYVFGNVNDGKSGTGVIFTRNPLNGEKGIYGSFLLKAEGTEIVGSFGAGSRERLEDNWDTPKGIDILRDHLPETYAQLEHYARFLETHFREIQDIEFTVQNGRLYFLQTRGNEKFTTPLARVRMLVDFVKEGLLTETEAIKRLQSGYTAPSYFVLTPQGILTYLWWLKTYLESPVLRKDFSRKPLASGIIILPGIVNAPIYANWKKDTGSDGIVVVKAVREYPYPDYATFSPSLLMHRGVGAISCRGNFSDHIAVRMRGAERIIPYLTKVDLNISNDGKTITFGDTNTTLESGSMIILDGNNGQIYSGTLSPSDLEDSEITKVNKGVIRRQDSVLFPYYETLLKWIILLEIDNIMSRVKKDGLGYITEEKLPLDAAESLDMFHGSVVLERLASNLAGNEPSVSEFRQKLRSTISDIKEQCQSAAFFQHKEVSLADVKTNLVAGLQGILELAQPTHPPSPPDTLLADGGGIGLPPGQPKNATGEKLLEYITSTRGKEIIVVGALEGREIVRLLKQGNFVSVNFRSLKSKEDKYRTIRFALIQIANFICDVYNLPPRQAIYIGEIFKNAFRHGSKLNFDYPIILHLKDKEEIKVLEVFDVASPEKVDEKDLEEAKENFLGGYGKGKLMLAAVCHKRQSIKDKDGNTLGTIVSIALNSKKGGDPFAGEPDTLIFPLTTSPMVSKAEEAPMPERQEGQTGKTTGQSTLSSALGGINFTKLPIITQPNGTWSFNLPPQQIQGLASLNLAEESIQINNLIAAGITPSPERIKDLCLAFYVQHDLRNGKDTALSCIRDTLRLHEGSLDSTEPEYRELLTFIESAK